MDLARDAFGFRGCAARRGSGAQQELGEPVGLDAVVLLGHVGAVRAQPGLDVHERHAGGDGGARAGERGVGVAADEDGSWPLTRDQLGEPQLGEAELFCAREREPTPRLWCGRGRRVASDLLVGHRLVVVLAGVHEDLLGDVRERGGDGRGLDDLGPRTDDGHGRADAQVPAYRRAGARLCFPQPHAAARSASGASCERRAAGEQGGRGEPRRRRRSAGPERET